MPGAIKISKTKASSTNTILFLNWRHLLYTTYLKNWFLTASAFSQNSPLHSRLVHAQWSLVPDQNFEKPSCQIPNFSNTLCIRVALFVHAAISYSDSV